MSRNLPQCYNIKVSLPQIATFGVLKNIDPCKQSVLSYRNWNLLLEGLNLLAHMAGYV